MSPSLAAPRRSAPSPCRPTRSARAPPARPRAPAEALGSLSSSFFAVPRRGIRKRGDPEKRLKGYYFEDRLVGSPFSDSPFGGHLHVFCLIMLYHCILYDIIL